eukprot:780075-Rhodomonas_salina.1
MAKRFSSCAAEGSTGSAERAAAMPNRACHSERASEREREGEGEGERGRKRRSSALAWAPECRCVWRV